MNKFLQTYLAIVWAIYTNYLLTRINYTSLFRYINKRIKYRKYYYLTNKIKADSNNTLILFHGRESNMIMSDIIDYINGNVITVDRNKDINPTIYADIITDKFLSTLKNEYFDNIVICNCTCHIDGQIKNFGTLKFFIPILNSLKFKGNLFMRNYLDLIDSNMLNELTNYTINTYYSNTDIKYSIIDGFLILKKVNFEDKVEIMDENNPISQNICNKSC